MRRKINYETLITLIFFIIIAATTIYDVLFNNYSKIGRLILIVVTIMAVKILFKITFLKKSQAAYISILSFVMISMYLGNVLNFYSYINNYDKILHFISGIIINILSVIIYLNFTNENINNINLKFIITFSSAFIIGCAGAWEIWEFTTDKIFGLQAQLNSLNDTMLDIICGSIGGLLSLILICICILKKKEKVFSFIIK